MSRLRKPYVFLESPEEQGCGCRSHTWRIVGRAVEVEVVSPRGTTYTKTFRFDDESMPWGNLDGEFEAEVQSDTWADINFWHDETLPRIERAAAPP